MERKYAFLLALLITLLIAGNWLFFNADRIFPERESVVLERVVDGDTVELGDGRTVRLLNIDTEETGRAWSEEAKEFLGRFEGKSVELEISGIDKYGRILGRLYSDGDYINLELVREGLAYSYLGEGSELKKFKEAERQARDKELGIWEKSKYYGCLKVEINKKDEYVDIIDNCRVDLTGWTLSDEGRKRYVFGFDEDRFRVLSEEGSDEERKYYWGREDIWDDEKDSIFVRDSEGFLVYYDSYGY